MLIWYCRWLVSQDKVDKAVGILRRFEHFNGKHISEETYKHFTVRFCKYYLINSQYRQLISFQASCNKAKKEEESTSTYSVLDLFKTPRLRKITLLLILIWMAISLVFDGHVRNVGSLGLDIFLTFTVASITEFPADTFLTLVLDRWGRRWLACGTMIASGVFSLLATTVPLGKSNYIGIPIINTKPHS